MQWQCAETVARFSGVDFRHRLITYEERRGRDVLEETRPLVLGMLRSVMLSLIFSFRDSLILQDCLRRMEANPRVEGPVQKASVEQYSSLNIIQGDKSYR